LLLFWEIYKLERAFVKPGKTILPIWESLIPSD